MRALTILSAPASSGRRSWRSRSVPKDSLPRDAAPLCSGSDSSRPLGSGPKGAFRAPPEPTAPEKGALAACVTAAPGPGPPLASQERPKGADSEAEAARPYSRLGSTTRKPKQPLKALMRSAALQLGHAGPGPAGPLRRCCLLLHLPQLAARQSAVLIRCLHAWAWGHWRKLEAGAPEKAQHPD